MGDEMPFLEWEWLQLVEESGSASAETGWLPRHVVVWDGGRAVAASPLYLKSHSMGEFVYDWSWANAAQRVGVPYYPKLISAIPFTPATGPRLLIAPGEDRALRARELVGAMHAVAQQARAGGVHVLFCTEAEVGELAALQGEERLQFQYHWVNAGYRDFDDFLARFRAHRRKELRRERRIATQEVSVERIEGAALTPELLTTFYSFYRDTCERYGGWDYLLPSLWPRMASEWPGRVVLFLARQGGRPVAGSLCVRKGDRLYGRYWGHDPAWEPPKFLHFELCYYAPIEYAVAEGIQLFEPGQGGEHKFARGFEPTLCRSVHWIFPLRLRGSIQDFLVREREAVRDHLAQLLETSPIREKPESSFGHR